MFLLRLSCSKEMDARVNSFPVTSLSFSSIESLKKMSYCELTFHITRYS